MKHYDYLVVGAGLAGATFARLMAESGKTVKVIEKRNHVAGNAHTKLLEHGEIKHVFGSHIFHTHDKTIWDFVNRFAYFFENRHSVIASNEGLTFHLPLGVTLFEEIHGENSFKDKDRIIAQEIANLDLDLSNAEGFAISKVGTSIYNTVIKNYTEKQWGRKATELPASIVKRLTISDSTSVDYFPDSDTYQGIPLEGYTPLVENMLDHPNIELSLDVDFFRKRDFYTSIADQVIYTGPIDKFFGYREGNLDYRSLRFEDRTTWESNTHPVINYTDKTPYTRLHDWKAYSNQGVGKRTETYEYPEDYTGMNEPYYPINDTKNNAIYDKYSSLAKELPNVNMLGRLAEYKYYDMDDVIASAMHLATRLLTRKEN